MLEAVFSASGVSVLFFFHQTLIVSCALYVQLGVRDCALNVVFKAPTVFLPPLPPSVTEPTFLWPHLNHHIWNKPLLLSKKRQYFGFFIL